MHTAKSILHFFHKLIGVEDKVLETWLITLFFSMFTNTKSENACQKCYRSDFISSAKGMELAVQIEYSSQK